MLLDDLLLLLRKAITGSVTKDFQQKPDWNNIFETARRNNIASVIYSVISKLPSEIQPDSDLMDQWKETAFTIGLHQYKQNIALQKLLRGLSELEIKPVIFKGPALAALYPEPMMRVSGDVDVLIKPEDRKKLIHYLEYNEFYLLEEQWKGEVLVYGSNQGLTLEFHFRLWEGYQGKRIKILEELELEQHTIHTKWLELEFETLDYEGHLIYQIYHLVKHFSLEGISLRYLADLSLFVNAYKDNIDFKHFWSTLKRLGYEEFCQALFVICVDKLGMNPVSLNPKRKIKKDTLDILLNDIAEVGNTHVKDNVSWNTLNTMMPYLTDDNTPTVSKARILMTIAFPSRSLLAKEFHYLKKYPFLLPLAWIQRVFQYFFKKEKSKTLSKVRKANQRLELMRKTKLIRN